MDMVMQLATAFLGSMGFALLFQVKRERLLLASLGGLLAWGVYLLMGLVTDQDVVRYFVASVALTIYGETLARVVKCPATLFIVTASIPLIPGGSLYKTMQFFMQNDLDAFSAQALTTVLLAVSIAVGMLFPTAIFQLHHRVYGQVQPPAPAAPAAPAASAAPGEPKANHVGTTDDVLK